MPTWGHGDKVVRDQGRNWDTALRSLYQQDVSTLYLHICGAPETPNSKKYAIAPNQAPDMHRTVHFRRLVRDIPCLPSGHIGVYVWSQARKRLSIHVRWLS